MVLASSSELRSLPDAPLALLSSFGMGRPSSPRTASLSILARALIDASARRSCAHLGAEVGARVVEQHGGETRDLVVGEGAIGCAECECYRDRFFSVGHAFALVDV